MASLRTITASALAFLALAGSATAQPAREPAKNIVLVHGAFADGSGWRAVYDILKKDGYRVSIAQPPLTSLADDVEATRRLLAQQEGKTVLVGHSYAGAVITVAGDDPKVSALVYVAGFQPDKGEAIGDLVSKFPPPNDAVRPTGAGFLELDPKKFPAVFAGDMPRADAEFLAVSQQPIAAAAFGMPVLSSAWRQKPSFGIVTTHDRALSPDLQRWMYKRSGSTVTEVQSSHAVYASHPAAVAKVIKAAAHAAR
jgi:pimeloyl-ACP methyl ester carboxylesterase